MPTSPQQHPAGFAERFGHAPQAIYSAPGRVNLLGEHTDYNGGAALPFAIQRRTTLSLRLREDSTVRIASTFTDEVVETTVPRVVDPSGDVLRGWSAYPLGVLRILGSIAELTSAHGFDALVDSDIPVGVGVSSSHALECATAVAFNEAYSLGLTPADLIPLTQRVEHEVVGSPTGLLDQSAILLARPDHAVHLEFGRAAPAPHPVPLGFDSAGVQLLVIDSLQRHTHAAGYADRRRECEQAAKQLGVSQLGELSPQQVDLAKDRLSDTEYRRARHVVTDTARVRQAVDLMAAADMQGLGRLLSASHVSQRDDFECSTLAIDTAVEAALAAGALGARLTGGGFGGACIALVRRADVASTSAAIADAVLQAGFPRPTIFPVRADAGARRDA
ncbi:MAG: galactokinase [Galactobacter sp.]